MAGNKDAKKSEEDDAKRLQFFGVDDEDESEDSEGSEAALESDSDKAEDKHVEDNGISREDAELVLDEYRSARTSGLPPPNVMFAASKKPEFLKASTVASKWDGEKQLAYLRAERARKVANPDVISASAKVGDDWSGGEENERKRSKLT